MLKYVKSWTKVQARQSVAFELATTIRLDLWLPNSLYLK